VGQTITGIGGSKRPELSPAFLNVFIAKFIMYQQIHQLSAEGYSIKKISAISGLNRRIVKKYRFIRP